MSSEEYRKVECKYFLFLKNVPRKFRNCLIWRRMYFVSDPFPNSPYNGKRTLWKYDANSQPYKQQSSSSQYALMLPLNTPGPGCCPTSLVFCHQSVKWDVGYIRVWFCRGEISPVLLALESHKASVKLKLFWRLQVIWLIKLKTCFFLVTCQFWETCMLPVACGGVSLKMMCC